MRCLVATLVSLVRLVVQQAVSRSRSSVFSATRDGRIGFRGAPLGMILSLPSRAVARHLNVAKRDARHAPLSALISFYQLPRCHEHRRFRPRKSLPRDPSCLLGHHHGPPSKTMIE